MIDRCLFGARVGSGSTRFCVHAIADAMSLCATDPLTRRLVRERMRVGLAGETVWECEVGEDLSGWSYWFELERGGERFGRVVDPYATAVREGLGVVERGAWDGVNGEGTVERFSGRPARPALDPTDAVIYELHVRDFTRDPLSGIGSEHRGRYLGLAERGGLLADSAISTGLDHILELGVNVVQLMPVQSFATPHRRWHEWGYMPSDWFALHGGYASGGDAFAAAREFGQLVDVLHEHGLRVTVDVVFNHNSENEVIGARSLAVLDPEGYYRRWDDGTMSDGAGCGNEFASESLFGRRLVRDACRYMVERFGVDGFRFDLMGLIDAETLRLVREDLDTVDRSLLLYGEPWAAAASPRPVLGKGFQRGQRIGVFHDGFRDGMRGELFDVTSRGQLTQGDVQGAHGLLAGPMGDGGGAVADEPGELIQYVECHDDLTLVDRLLASDPEGGMEAALERSALSALVLACVRGVPFVHSGQEFGRTKEGVSNTYNRGDDLNNIHWSLKRERHRLFRHYRRAIRLRREHVMFRPSRFEDARSGIGPLGEALGAGVPGGVIGAVFMDTSGEDTWSSCLVAMNTGDSGVSIVLNDAGWLNASYAGVLLDADAPHYGERSGLVVELKPRGFSVVYLPRDSATATATS